MKKFFYPFVVLLLILSTSRPVYSETPYEKLDKRIREALDVVESMIRDPDFSETARKLLKRCRGVLIFPSVTRGGFILSGRFGRGVMLAHRSDGTWSPPAFYTLGGGSLGFQIGVQKIDLVLFVMNERGVEAMARGKITLGVDFSVAAGPVGISASAGTDVTLKSEIYAYSKARGVFAGISLKGASVRPDRNANCVYYGDPTILPWDILMMGKVTPPPGAKALMDELKRVSSEGEKK